MQISLAQPTELGPSEFSAWHSMQRMTGTLANPFLCPEFSVAIGKFRSSARVAVLAQGLEIIGFFPFERRRLGLGVPIGAGLNNCQGLIHVPAAEWDPREVLRASKVSVWQFDKLAQGQRGFERYAAAKVPASAVDLTSGFAVLREKLQARSPEFYRKLDRTVRRLQREVGEIRYVADSRDPVAFRKFIGWKSDQCRRNRWVNAFDRPWVIDMVEYISCVRSDSFASMFSVLYAGETPIAGTFGLRSRDFFAGWFTGYDTRFGKYSPGFIQLLHQAEELAAAGVRLIDLGTGGEGYKQRLRTHELYVTKGMAARGPLTGGAHRIRSDCRTWAGSHAAKHPAVFRAADQLLRHCGQVN